MPIMIQLPDAAVPVERKYRRYFSNAERIFKFTETPVDFISNGIISNDQFTSLLDGDPVVKHFRNMTINEGHTIIPTLRCKGMYLLIEGDLIVNGTLSMTARGAKAAGKFVGIDHENEKIYFNETDIFSQDILTVGKVGGVCPNVSNSFGVAGANRACGSGGSGYVEVANGASGGIGGPGTSFSGGPGGGAAPRGVGGNGAINGGAGGAGLSPYVTGRYWPGGGGAGNPGGAGGGQGGGPGQNGTGGLLILIVKGSIIFGPTGQIVSAGSKGGVGYESGGGSGGGAIHVFYKGAISNPEKIVAPGGAPGDRFAVAGYTAPYGYAGGNGSVSINKF